MLGAGLLWSADIVDSNRLPFVLRIIVLKASTGISVDDCYLGSSLQDSWLPCCDPRLGTGELSCDRCDVLWFCFAIYYPLTLIVLKI